MDDSLDSPISSLPVSESVVVSIPDQAIPQQQKCGNCASWVEQVMTKAELIHKLISTDQTGGYCKLRAPYPVLGALAQYPLTTSEDWCGEWKKL